MDLKQFVWTEFTAAYIKPKDSHPPSRRAHATRLARCRTLQRPNCRNTWRDNTQTRIGSATTRA